MKLFKILLYIVILAVFIRCQQQNNSESKKANKNSQPATSKALEKANKYLIRTEYEDIENYIRRHGLDMEETGSGLRYLIIEDGNGPAAESGKTSVLDYKMSLLTGDIIYASKNDGQIRFTIGKGNVESGLEEAMQFLQAGDKVKLILPAHLAYGLLGDNNKIPPRSTIIYDIEVIDIK